NAQGRQTMENWRVDVNQGVKVLQAKRGDAPIRTGRRTNSKTSRVGRKSRADAKRRLSSARAGSPRRADLGLHRAGAYWGPHRAGAYWGPHSARAYGSPTAAGARWGPTARGLPGPPRPACRGPTARPAG